MVRLLHRLKWSKVQHYGTVTAASSDAPALARALLRALVDENLVGDRSSLVAQFSSIAEAESAMRAFLATAIGLPNGAAFDPF